MKQTSVQWIDFQIKRNHEMPVRQELDAGYKGAQVLRRNWLCQQPPVRVICTLLRHARSNVRQRPGLSRRGSEKSRSREPGLAGHQESGENL